MRTQDFFDTRTEPSQPPAPRPDALADAAPPAAAWRTLPLAGRFEVVYEDARGRWSTRVLDARELRLGPGRTLLGGTDRRHGLYRGLRADRIRRLSEPATGLRIETGILDGLLARAEAQRRARSRPRRPHKAAQIPPDGPPSVPRARLA